MGGLDRIRAGLGPLRRHRWFRPALAGGGLLLVLVLVLVAWTGRAREVVRRAMEPASLARVETFAPEIRAAAAEQGLDPCLIAGMVYAESRGKVDAISSVGALGLMQLMPAAVEDASRALGIDPPSDAQLVSDGGVNLRLGARHFAWTLEHEGGDPERALCAYNAGRGRLGSWIEEAGSYARWRDKQLRDGNSQVLAYARKVLEYAETFRQRGVISGAAAAPASDDELDSDS